MNPPAFDEAISVKPLSSNTYSANLQEAWCIGTVPHGGYTTAIFHRLVTTHFAHTHPSFYKVTPTPISIQLSFLRRTGTGEAVLTVEDTKLGARTSTLHVTLLQRREVKKNNNNDGSYNKKGEEKGGEKELEAKVTGYITVSPWTAELGVSAKTSWSLHPPPTPGSGINGRVNLSALSTQGRDGAWNRLGSGSSSSSSSSSFRRALQHVEFYVPSVSSAGPVESSSSSSSGDNKRGIVDQWSRFRPGGDKNARWTDESVAFLIDMFPVTLDGLGRISSSSSSTTSTNGSSKEGGGGGGEVSMFWYPTVTLNVDVKKRLPAQGVEWLYSRIQNKVIRDGRTDVTVEVVDEEGEIVALATQVALILSASRNIGQRSTTKRSGKL